MKICNNESQEIKIDIQKKHVPIENQHWGESIQKITHLIDIIFNTQILKNKGLRTKQKVVN